MQKQKKRGFTLIELIVVVAILVALLLILVPRLTGFTSTAAEVQCQQTRQKVMEMYNAYQIKGEPVSIGDLLKNKDDEYFISTPKCASGGKLTAIEIKGVVTLIKCSKHGSIASDNLDYTPKGIQQTMISIMQEFVKDSDLMKECIGYMNNDQIRKFMKMKFMEGTGLLWKRESLKQRNCHQGTIRSKSVSIIKAPIIILPWTMRSSMLPQFKKEIGIHVLFIILIIINGIPGLIIFK